MERYAGELGALAAAALEHDRDTDLRTSRRSDARARDKDAALPPNRLGVPDPEATAQVIEAALASRTR
jgi:hypothetical protein